MSKINSNVDVICQHNADGTIMPMRFRLMNEDGIYETYTIKGYRQILRKDVYTTPDGVLTDRREDVFECRVLVLDVYHTVRLYFNRITCKWRVAI